MEKGSGEVLKCVENEYMWIKILKGKKKYEGNERGRKG